MYVLYIIEYASKINIINNLLQYIIITMRILQTTIYDLFVYIYF